MDGDVVMNVFHCDLFSFTHAKYLIIILAVYNAIQNTKTDLETKDESMLMA